MENREGDIPCAANAADEDGGSILCSSIEALNLTTALTTRRTFIVESTNSGVNGLEDYERVSHITIHHNFLVYIIFYLETKIILLLRSLAHMNFQHQLKETSPSKKCSIEINLQDLLPLFEKEINYKRKESVLGRM